MKVETVVDADRADQLVSDVHAVVTAAEPALEDDELETLSEVVEFIEDVACIETGERIMESPITEKKYRVTRWIDAGEGQVVALAKEELEGAEA